MFAETFWCTYCKVTFKHFHPEPRTCIVSGVGGSPIFVFVDWNLNIFVSQEHMQYFIALP